jgi:DNA-binding CsgD family transcriptional regulator
MRSMRRWRLVISAGGLVLGIVLVAMGNVLVGVIVGGLAVARLVMFSRMPARHQGGRTRVDPSGGGWVRAQARDEVLVAAQVVGCTGRELWARFEQGKSIAEIAAERSIAVESITNAVAADLELRARNAAAAGTLSQDDAQRIHEDAPRFAQRLIYVHRDELARSRRI